MSEQVVDGNPAGADTASAGSSFLSSLAPAAAGASPAPAPDPASAEGAVREVMDGPPEGVPEKFWDSESKSIRVNELTQAYTNLEKLIGSEKVPVPKDENDQEAWDRWYKASGRPEAADGYTFEEPTLPEGMTYDGDLEQAARQSFHAAGLNAKQAAIIHDQFVKFQIEHQAAWADAQNQMKAKLTSDLQRKYGGEYQAKLGKASTVMDKYGTPEFRDYLNQSGMGNDPRMLDVLIRIGEDMGGETRLQGKAPQSDPAPQDLDQAIAKFRDKNAKALHDKSHPSHDSAVKQLQDLFKMRYPERAS